MKLSVDEVRLALAVTRWVRENGWTVKGRSMSFDGYDRGVTWTNDVDLHSVTIERFRDGAAILWDASDVNVHSVTQAVDALVMFELLPVRFSSAFQAGRESAYEVQQWKICFSEGEYHQPWNGAWSAADAEAHLRNWRRQYPDAWLEHCRTGATDWSRVDV